MLRRVAGRGVFVSSHPDPILRVPQILDRSGRSMEPIPLAAVRITLRNSRDAADLLASLVVEGTWHPARQAAHDLDTSHKAFSGDRLGGAFEHASQDDQRILCYALGSLGADEWAWDLLHRLRSMRDPKRLMPFALDGLSHMFLHARVDGVSRASNVLVHALALDESGEPGGLSAFSMRYTLGHIVGDHVDEIIQKWLTSTSFHVRKLATDALGDARIQRSVPVLEELMSDADERIQNAASRALGAVDTPQATEALFRSGQYAKEEAVVANWALQRA